ncbi:hypothetical protein KSP39_PZI001672 [Platanthera zijinensis]|uniref:RING-type E3 ubiquitin transferase n=1 Tax=Platanthera zijinensis TaxID=2320716 RepID=A0AAP0C018_9ASPA
MAPGRGGCSFNSNSVAELPCILNLNFLVPNLVFAMDGYSGKRVVSGFGSGISFRDVNQEDRTSQCRNRIGCSTKHSSSSSIQNTDTEKLKCVKPPFRFRNSNSLSASSSKLFSSATNFRKYYHESKSKASLKEEDVSKSGILQPQAGDDFKWDSVFDRGSETEHFENRGRPRIESLSTKSESSRGSGTRLSSIYGKQSNRKLGSVIQDTASSFLRRSSAPRFAAKVPKTTPQAITGRPERYSLSNLGCTSISDILPSGSSGGSSKNGVSAGRKLQYGEGSSKAVLSQQEQQTPHEVSRLMRNQLGKDVVVSVRTRRGSSGSQRSEMRSSTHEDEPTAQFSDPHDQVSIPDDIQESSEGALSTELPSAFQASSFTGRAGNRSSQSRMRSGSEGRDDYRCFNMEGIAEVLLALERIEQDEELTDEQLLVLEANLFLGSLSLYDQHRDMRLDIDNMSYEELLALEEKMGTVNTALPEEELSKCLKRSTYRSSFTFPGISRRDDDDVKCSICQEEYSTGAEVGRLPCEHRYHIECIRQWLGLKNWCPICKVAAAATPASKPPHGMP